MDRAYATSYVSSRVGLAPPEAEKLAGKAGKIGDDKLVVDDCGRLQHLRPQGREIGRGFEEEVGTSCWPGQDDEVAKLRDVQCVWDVPKGDIGGRLAAHGWERSTKEEITAIASASHRTAGQKSTAERRPVGSVPQRYRADVQPVHEHPTARVKIVAIHH